MGLRFTHTYATLAVSRVCIDEVVRRLEAAGPQYLDDFVTKDDEGNPVVHWGGDIALVVDTEQPSS
jgi:hypothetical protein